MCLGSATRARRALAAFAIVSAACSAPSDALAGDFSAFTWATAHPASTPNVSGMVQVDPWADLNQVADRLKALPAGKRWVIFFWMTDDMADNPADRCIQRTWELRTRQVPAPVTKAAAPAASGLAKGSQGRTALPAATLAANAAAAARASTAAKAPAAKLPAAKAPVATKAPVAAKAPAAPAMVTVTERVSVDRLTAFRGPWMDNGIAAIRTRVQTAMQRLKQLGAPIDGVAVDNETTLAATHFLGNPGALAAIQADPRWPALAQSMGLPAAITDMSWGSDIYFLWTERMASRFDAAMNTAVYAPIRALYPDAAVSNYCTGQVLGPYASPDVNGHFDRRVTTGFGTHDNAEFYGWIAPSKVAKIAGSAPVSESWLAFRGEVHRIRGMNASSTRPKTGWVAARSWPGETWGPVPFAGTEVWDELVLQLGMNGIRTFLEFSPETAGRSLAANLANRAEDRAALDALLAELNARAGGATPAILAAQQPSWDDRVIATGRVVGPKVVWRFSFAEDVGGVTVTLSDGSTRVIKPEAGRAGAWFEHPAGVSLVMDAAGRRAQMQLHTPEEIAAAQSGSSLAGL